MKEGLEGEDATHLRKIALFRCWMKKHRWKDLVTKKGIAMAHVVVEPMTLKIVSTWVLGWHSRSNLSPIDECNWRGDIALRSWCNLPLLLGNGTPVVTYRTWVTSTYSSEDAQ